MQWLLYIKGKHIWGEATNEKVKTTNAQAKRKKNPLDVIKTQEAKAKKRQKEKRPAAIGI